MQEHEINRIAESELVDIFMDNASASAKLWEIFNEKRIGNRTMLKTKLLAKYMTYLEQGRATKDQSHKRKKSKSKTKKESVHAIQQTSGYPSRGRGRGNSRGYRGGRRHTTRWRRNRNNRGPHNPPQNCHQYGHTPETCWKLHPELKPSSGPKRKQIFALQRAVNKAKADLSEAISKYESSTESEHSSAPISNSDEHKTDETSSADNENHENDSESSSPIQFKYRPRQ